MQKRKNLERAVVLGLILSTGIYGGAWAEQQMNSIHRQGVESGLIKVDDEEVRITNSNSGTEGEKYGIWGSAGLIQGVNITASENLKKLTLDIVGKDKADVVAGIYLGVLDSKGYNNHPSTITLDLSNALNITTTSETWIDNYAIGTNVSGNVITLGASDIVATAKKTYADKKDGETYAATNSDGSINLTAIGKIQLTSESASGDAYGFDSWNPVENNVKGATIYISATAENGNAYAVKINADDATKGINNRFASSYNKFTANSTNGKAYALLAEKGTKVDIIGSTDKNVIANYFESNKIGVKLTEGSVLNATGNTIIKGSENGLIISGNGTSTTADGDETYQVVVDGDLHALADNGTSSHLQNGASLHVTGNQIINSSEIIEGGSTEKVDGSLIGFADFETELPIEGTGITVKENSTLTVGGNIILSAEKTALDVNVSSITASGVNGSNYIKGGTNGISAVGSAINLSGATYIEGTKGIGVSADTDSVFNVTGNTTVVGDSNGIVLTGKSSATEQSKITGYLIASAENGTAITLTNTKMTVIGDEIISGENGLVINSSQHNVTGDLIGRADNIAVNVMGKNSDLTVGGNILVEGGNKGGNKGGNIGVTVENNTITVNGGDGTGANVIKSNSGNALKAVESIVTLNSGANGANSIVADESFGAEGVYYTGTAINATSASNGAENNRTGGSKIDVLGSENFIGGTVRANGVKSIVNIGGSFDNDGNLTSSGTNYITSAAHGRDGSSNEDVVSAVFAQNGANVNIKGKRNYIIAKAENVDSATTKYNERAVWAQGGSQVNIEGETIISASKAEVVFDENGIPKNITIDDLKNNNLGIAIAAGTGEITNITDPGDLVENIPEGVGKSTINLNYKGSSVILGDVVSGWNGLVNIGDGIETSSNGSKLNFYGSAMAANGGQINLDLGEGSVWYGRADDYQEAHVDGEGNTFFNPAFSNEIIDNGTVNLKMGTGSAWYVQGQSWISNITIDENAENTLIDLVSANTDHNSTAHALTIGELNGNTTFHMSLDGNRTTSDMLYIKEANGDYIVTLEDAVQTADMYTDGTNRFNGLRFATIGAGSNADFRVFSSDTGFYDVEYQVEREEYDANSYENHHYNTSDGNDNGDADMEKPGDDSLGDFFGDSGSGAETQNAKIALLDEV